MSKVEHPKFEGRVMPNEEEYQTPVCLKFRYCLVVSYIIISILITCILAEEIAFESGHFRTFYTSVTLTLDRIPLCTIHQPLPTYQTSFKSEKKYVDGQTDRYTVNTDIETVFTILNSI